MTLMEVVGAELGSGLARLEGTRVDVVVPLRQRVVDELIPLIPGVPANLSVVLGDERQVRVRYGSFHADARLHHEVTLTPRPVLALKLSSQLVAFALARLPLPPFVRVSGRDVHVHLAAIPALADIEGLWPHVEHIGLTSVGGGLEIALRVHVRAAGPPIRLPARRGDQATRGVSSPLASWAQRQLDAGLPAFAGARASASVRAGVSLLNDVLAVGLADAARGQAKTPIRSDPGAPDLAMVARMVRHVRVDAAPGVVTLDVEGGVDG